MRKILYSMLLISVLAIFNVMGAMKNDASQNDDLIGAILDHDIEKVNKLLYSGIDVNTVDNDGYMALHYAAVCGCAEVFKMLLNGGAKHDTAGAPNNFSVLHSAVKSCNKEIVTMCLDVGADVNVRDARRYTPLHIASQEGCIEIVKILLEVGADVNARTREGGDTPLAMAQKYNHTAIIELLLKYGAI